MGGHPKMEARLAGHVDPGDVVRTATAWREVLDVVLTLEGAANLLAEDDVMAGANDSRITADRLHANPALAPSRIVRPLRPGDAPPEWSEDTDEEYVAGVPGGGTAWERVGFTQIVGNRLDTGEYVALRVLTPERMRPGLAESLWLLLHRTDVLDVFPRGGAG